MNLCSSLKEVEHILRTSREFEINDILEERSEQTNRMGENADIQNVLKGLLNQNTLLAQISAVGRPSMNESEIKEWVVRIRQQFLPELQENQLDTRKQLALLTAPEPLVKFIRQIEAANNTWDLIERQILENFTDFEKPHLAREKLANIKQEQNESLILFSQKVKDLTTRAYPLQDLNNIAIVQIMCRALMYGLKDVTVGRSLIRKDFISFEECVKAAKEKIEMSERTEMYDFQRSGGHYSKHPSNAYKSNTISEAVNLPAMKQAGSLQSTGSNSSQLSCRSCISALNQQNNETNSSSMLSSSLQNMAVSDWSSTGRGRPESTEVNDLVQRFDYQSGFGSNMNNETCCSHPMKESSGFPRKYQKQKSWEKFPTNYTEHDCMHPVYRSHEYTTRDCYHHPEQVETYRFHGQHDSRGGSSHDQNNRDFNSFSDRDRGRGRGHNNDYAYGHRGQHYRGRHRRGRGYIHSHDMNTSCQDDHSNQQHRILT